jgi:cyanophycinase
LQNNVNGHLVIIGGAEDKIGESVILKQAPEMLEPGDKLTILTTATEKPYEAGRDYQNAFSRIGMLNVQILNIETRDDANDETMINVLRQSKCIFLTGGDQLRITSILGGTSAYWEIKNVYYSGGLIMGTSAGASVMSSTMIVNGNDNEPARKCTLKMAPGLGLFNGTIIDQHFDQRGRFGRLLCGVSENPEILGIGIDEDTAIKVYPDMHFEIIGTNAVTIIDGCSIKSSNISELYPDEIIAVTGVTIHALPKGYGYDMNKREVLRLKESETV